MKIFKPGYKKVFFIRKSISKKQIEQLIKFSNSDPEVIKFTSDRIRYKDRNSYNEWLLKKRMIYVLTDKERNLLGIIWFGKETLPQRHYTQNLEHGNFNITFAIRIYKNFRGKGLAKLFMSAVFSDFYKRRPYSEIKGIWLETSVDNLPAVTVYKKFGFKEITSVDARGKILMVYQVAGV